MHDPCKICGQPVHRNGSKYCSYACAAQARQHYKRCVICGNLYPCSPTDMVLTCSRDCSTELRRRQAEELGHTDRIKVEAAKHVAETPLEQWQTAKYWELQAPDGTVYHVKNLIEFFRQHEDMIDGTPRQAAWGIGAVKRTLRGTIKKGKSYQWKGWTLLSWDDCGVKPRKAAKTPHQS